VNVRILYGPNGVSLCQPRKGLQHPVQPLAMLGFGREFTPVATHFEIFDDGHPGKYPAALGRLDETIDHAPVRLDLRDVATFEPHRTRC
jgi:hypothetical protein